MAETTLTVSEIGGGYASAATTLTMAAADTVNQNDFVASGNDIIVFHNTGASSRTITITSSNDPFGRTGDIAAESIAAGAYKVFGPMKTQGWVQSDGKILVQANHAEVKIGIIRI